MRSSVKPLFKRPRSALGTRKPLWQGVTKPNEKKALKSPYRRLKPNDVRCKPYREPLNPIEQLQTRLERAKRSMQRMAYAYARLCRKWKHREHQR